MPTVNYTISFSSNVNAVFTPINNSVDKANNGMRGLTKSIEGCWKQLMSLNLAADAVKNLGSAIDDLSKPGAVLNSSMSDLQAITGLADESLKSIEVSARKSAKAFGTDAAQNVESYKLLLSQLSPELGNNSEALKMMGDNVNVLSKTMGGDTVAATNVLTTAMNQFDVSLDDPIKAGKIMADMMNVMAAAAREGSAELPQIQEALRQTGMMAKTVGVTFSETNAAIQVLDKAGKKRAEGGVALRNVMTSLSQGRFLPKEVQEELQAAGVSINKLTDQTAPLAERLRAVHPIFQDTALMTKMFGRENMASAIALVGQIDELERYNTVIQGTNTAFEQADVIMRSYPEKLKRQAAWWDDLKISIFNATNSFMPLVKGLSTVASGFGTAAYTMSGFSALTQTKLIQAVFGANKALAAGTGMLIGYIKTTKIATIAVKAFTYANMLLKRSMGVFAIAAIAVAAITAGIIKFSAANKLGEKSVAALSGKIGTEKRQLNDLFDALKRTNPESKRRKEIIDEINSKYPDLLRNLNLEKASEQEIESARKKANDELAELTEMFRAAESIEVQSDFLDLFGIQSAVVKSYTFEQETHSNRQSFRLSLLSDSPYEIKLKEDNVTA